VIELYQNISNSKGISMSYDTNLVWAMTSARNDKINRPRLALSDMKCLNSIVVAMSKKCHVYVIQ